MTDEDRSPSMDPEDTMESDVSDPAAQAQFQHRRIRLAAVFRQRYTSLVAYGRSLGSRNPADAEDSVQSTFLRVLAKRTSLLDATDADAEPHLQSVLLTGVKGRMRNHGRNGAAATRSRANLAPPPRSADFYPPDQIVEYQELHNHYQAALARLSPRERQVYHMIRDEDYTYAQVAEQLGISAGAAKKYFQRAIDKLTLALALWL